MKSVVISEEQTIARLTFALRALEEHRLAGLALPTDVLFYLGALDRRLSSDERRYVAMVFGASKDAREEMTTLLVRKLGVGRGAVIAGIRAHLEGTATKLTGADASLPACKLLDELRTSVLHRLMEMH